MTDDSFIEYDEAYLHETQPKQEPKPEPKPIPNQRTRPRTKEERIAALLSKGFKLGWPK